MHRGAVSADHSNMGTARRAWVGALVALTGVSLLPAVTEPALAAGPVAPSPTAPGPTVPGPPVPPPYVPDLGPPPPTFPYDEDSGRQLVLDQRDAAALVLQSHADLAAAEARLPGLFVTRRRLAVRVDVARRAHDLAARAVTRHERRMRRASIDIYVEATPTIESVESIGALVDADSVIELSRAEELRAAQKEAVASRTAAVERDAADAESHVIATGRALGRHDDAILAATQAVVDARAVLAAAEARVQELEAEESRWLIAAARTAASPIMGPSALDVDDLVRKALDSNPNPALTVSIHELARLFLEEGAAEGVRGDVAFSQSILETGAFSNPSCCSIVVWTDNNFAGIGACDSCEHGRVFRTAREGVRAQIQALRTYADPTVDSPDDYASPMVLPKQLQWIRAGKTKIWYELTGKWATGAGYGLHIFDVYRPMYATRTAPVPAPVVAVDPAIASAQAARSLASLRFVITRSRLSG